MTTISEVKWQDVRVCTPPYNTPVLAIYLEPVMSDITEQIAIAYYDKTEGWYFEGVNQPVKNVIYWSDLPAFPVDSRFEGVSSLKFKSRFSCDPMGNVITKVIRRKHHGDNELDNKDAKASDIVSLQRKFSMIPQDKKESFMDKIRILNEGKNP